MRHPLVQEIIRAYERAPGARRHGVQRRDGRRAASACARGAARSSPRGAGRARARALRALGGPTRSCRSRWSPTPRCSAEPRLARQDRPTDVLAFAQREGAAAGARGGLLGDVVISVDTAARRQAAERGHRARGERAAPHPRAPPSPRLRPRARPRRRAGCSDGAGAVDEAARADAATGAGVAAYVVATGLAFPFEPRRQRGRSRLALAWWPSAARWSPRAARPRAAGARPRRRLRRRLARARARLHWVVDVTGGATPCAGAGRRGARRHLLARARSCYHGAFAAGAALDWPQRGPASGSRRRRSG